MRALDWSKTPLGAAESWPLSLKTAVRIMLTSRYAMWMAWGPELTFFCNDAYLPTVGIKRDWVLQRVSSQDVGEFVPIPRYWDGQVRVAWVPREGESVEVGRNAYSFNGFAR